VRRKWDDIVGERRGGVGGGPDGEKGTAATVRARSGEGTKKEHAISLKKGGREERGYLLKPSGGFCAPKRVPSKRE